LIQSDCADQAKLYEADRLDRAERQLTSDTAQAGEIAGLRKSLAAYEAARLVLAVPVVQDVDPDRMTAVGERIAATKPPNARQVRAARSKPFISTLPHGD